MDLATRRTRAAQAVASATAAAWMASQSDLGVAPYLRSEPLPRATQRLDILRNVRWLAAEAFHADAPLEHVLDHLRREQDRLERQTGTGGEPSGRLKEWLEKQPEELAKYREFRRVQSSGTASLREWQVLRQKVSEIPLSLGGGDGMRAKTFDRKDVELAFRRIAQPGPLLGSSDSGDAA